MWMNPIHGGAAPSMRRSVFYTGTDTLYEGYALCYDFNAADVNQENETQTTPDVGEEYKNNARRILVEKPTEKNKIHFAGVVDEASNGVTGPAWVTINVPGSVCNVYAYSNADHERSADGNASGQIFNVVVGQYYMMDGGYPGRGAAMVLQDVDRSSTAGLVMAELMDGAPSGGYCTVAVHSDTGTELSVQLSAIPIYAGVYEFTEQSGASGAILGSDMLAADGKWRGQRVQFKAGSTILSSIFSCVVSTILKAQYSTYAGAVASANVELSAANEYMTFEWDGVRWVVLGGHESIAT